MPTLRDVASAAGVSLDTASRVLAGRNKEAWPSTRARADRIRACAQRLGYRTDASARATRTGRHGAVGLLLRNAPDKPTYHPAAFDILLGAHDRLEADGIALVVVRMADLVRDDGPRALRERMLDGAIAVGELPPGARERVEALWPRCVWAEGPVWSERGCVRRDEIAAGGLAARGLIAGGARRLVWIGPPAGPTAHYSVAERLAGARAAAGAAGVPLVELVADPFEPLTPERSRALDAALRDGDVGVIASSRDHAQWLANRSAARGRTAPRHFLLASCDDDPQTASVWPQLARVANSRYALGRSAADLLIAALGSRRRAASVRLPGTWVAGATAGPR